MKKFFLAAVAAFAANPALANGLWQDLDGDGYLSPTCGWETNPCPVDYVASIDVFDIDMDDNDPVVGSYCSIFAEDPYCKI